MRVYAAKSFSGLYLFYDVVSERSNHRLFTMNLLPLFGNEAMLDQGRFERFSCEDQEHRINLTIAHTDSAALQAWMTGIVGWIAEQTPDAWSMVPRMVALREGEMRFSFAHATTAVVFALVWT